MIYKHLKSFLFLLVFAVVLSGCDYYKNMPFVSIPPQTISGPVVIGSEWIEIIPPEPLKPYARTNWLNLELVGYDKNNNTDDEEGKILNLADGRKTKIEAVLYDERGESYELQIGGTSSGVTFYRKLTKELVDGKVKYNVVQFPTDRVYTKLKVRSEIPLKCDKIEWIGSNPK